MKNGIAANLFNYLNNSIFNIKFLKRVECFDIGLDFVTIMTFRRIQIKQRRLRRTRNSRCGMGESGVCGPSHGDENEVVIAECQLFQLIYDELKKCVILCNPGRFEHHMKCHLADAILLI